MVRKIRIFIIILVFGAIVADNAIIVQAGTSVTAKDSHCDWDCKEIAGFFIPEDGCALFIDLDICTMIVYIDGTVFKAFPVSGGTSSTPSPVGTWLIVNVSNWGEGFGGSWIGLNVPWGKYGIHGTVEPWVIGEYNASHGCIRMKDKDVNELKKLVSRGSIVHIKHDSLPFRVMTNGMVGSDVQKTQKMLRNQGFYTGGIDGVFGDGTESAVKGFQKTYHLKADGVVGGQTYEKICEQNAHK